MIPLLPCPRTRLHNRRIWRALKFNCCTACFCLSGQQVPNPFCWSAVYGSLCWTDPCQSPASRWIFIPKRSGNAHVSREHFLPSGEGVFRR